MNYASTTVVPNSSMASLDRAHTFLQFLDIKMKHFKTELNSKQNCSVACLSNPLSNSKQLQKATMKLAAMRKCAAFHSVLGKDLENFTGTGDSVAPAREIIHEQSYFAKVQLVVHDV